MGRSRYGVVARLVWDGGEMVRVPEEMGEPRADQLQGTAGERLSELAGRACYDSCGKGRSSAEYHKHIKEVGHFSVYEHHQMTVFVGNDKVEFGRTLQARTLVNRPGLFVLVTKEGTRLTFNPRVLLDWDQWSDPEDPDAPWLKDVLHYYAEQDWPRITPCRGYRTAENLAGVTLCSRRVPPEHDEEKWVSLFMAASRGWSHEHVRHRFRTGVSQRSTRFVDEDGSSWVDHPLVQDFLAVAQAEALDGKKRVVESVLAVKGAARLAYRTVVEVLQEWLLSRGADKLTARKQARGAGRGYLGNALYTELIFSASVAQWKRMLRLRCHDAADAEIRAVFVEALDALQTSRYCGDFDGFGLRPANYGLGQVAVESSGK